MNMPEIEIMSIMSQKNIQAWIFAVLDLLENLWHNEASAQLVQDMKHEEPLDGLILTVLSQNTNDKNRDMAFTRLKQKFPTWADVVKAGLEPLEEAVRPAGLAPTKAQRILTILETVHKDFGDYTIAPLKERGRDAAWDYMTALPGVGAKTASCVLLFDMGLKAFPVDTHVSRIARRIGFVPEKTPADEISFLFVEQVPLERCLGGHVNMIEHGRAVCCARKPFCDKCPVNSLCKSATA